MSDQKQEGARLIEGLESGTMSVMDAAMIAEGLDHVLVYAIVSYLRAIHPASDPAASGVLERVVSMTSASPTVVRKHGEGEQDPVLRWFESEYTYTDFRGRGSDLVGILVDKIES